MIITDDKLNLDRYLEIHHSSDEVFSYICIKSLICPICDSSDLIKHGKYFRDIIDDNGDAISINIFRLKCNCCNKTHAIIPSFIIPYFKLPLNVILDIILLLKKRKSYSYIVDKLFAYDLDLSYVYFIDKKLEVWEFFYPKIVSALSTKTIADMFNVLNNNLKFNSLRKIKSIDFRKRVIRYFLHIKLSNNTKISSPT